MTKPIILVKICYKLLYVIQGVENSFSKVANFLASPDIRVWLHICLLTMLLLIGLALFTPRVYVRVRVRILVPFYHEFFD